MKKAIPLWIVLMVAAVIIGGWAAYMVMTA